MTKAAEAWEKNGQTPQLARAARHAPRADWPGAKETAYLNDCRRLTNELANAAMYQHLRGEHAEAIELIRDVLHLADLLRKNPEPNNLVRPLVATGLDAAAMYRLTTIIADIRLTDDPANRRDLQIVEARRLIEALLNTQTPEQMLQHIEGEFDLEPIGPIDRKTALWRATETRNRANAERNFAAMSLACHLFRRDKQRWPNELKELVPIYLPRVMIDPWGDGVQTLGYVLIKAGLPDGGDRPLVYSRCESRDGLFYRVDQPTYGFYVGDGTDRAAAEQKRGGQFRDVTRWMPPAGPITPTTKPLPQ